MMLALPTWLATAYWLPATGLMAYAQGLLMPAIRRTPPGAEARRQAFALHWLLTTVYFLPLVLVLCFAPEHSIKASIIAVLARLLLFDPLLNLGAGDKLFAVGQTAASDRALQGLAQRLGWPAERVRAVAWVVCLLGAGLLAIHFSSKLST
jgi:ribose/xylose/arabinose/galactoside ABC-type transport system permease subunit